MASCGGQQSKDDMPAGENTNSGLRQPKEETISRLLNNHGGGQTKASNLSASAPEFVPRFGGSSGRSGYKPPTLSASAPVFVPRQQMSADVYSQPQQIDYDPVLEEFKQTLRILNTSPGNVEEYMRPLCEKFRHGVTTSEHLAEIIDVLFLQSVAEANFRYTGARICQQICSRLKDHALFNTFRNAFLKRCQKQYEKRELLVTLPDKLDELTGFTLFMGELFLNLEVPSTDGRTTKMKILPNILKDLVLTLLSQPGKETVKCSCQLLKLVGASMEDMMEPADHFDEVFSQLQLVMQSRSLEENTKFLIKSVLNLKLSNWGRPESSSSSQGGDSEFNGSVSHELLQNEPVFYNASGQTITREEAGFYNEEVEDGEYILNEDEEQAFLEWQAESNEGVHNDAYSSWSNNEDQTYFGYYANDDEMDDETEAAYEEFLKQSQRQGGYH
ncbi:polyadenylate-binding protein-interacting protein 1-like isoform X1 [Haliotis rubra]|uniref:polyadenylate-binding protein-interacting protein 1-like isoform X1 n=1 Tax=Haliotis rubra TaxID=36100 RepID=UPI001EE63120|nr:polyadenylate-binding protein-interacting protein 1-like isoform X1 [Haliotis rubra]